MSVGLSNFHDFFGRSAENFINIYCVKNIKKTSHGSESIPPNRPSTVITRLCENSIFIRVYWFCLRYRYGLCLEHEKEYKVIYSTQTNNTQRLTPTHRHTLSLTLPQS